MTFIHLFKPARRVALIAHQMGTAMMMIYLNLSQSASPPLSLLGPAGPGGHPFDGSMKIGPIPLLAARSAISSK